MCTHAYTSLDKFIAMKGDFTKPMLFTAETPQRKFVAYIDPDNRFCIEDKLSQVTTTLYIVLYIFNTPVYGTQTDRKRARR